MLELDVFRCVGPCFVGVHQNSNVVLFLTQPTTNLNGFMNIKNAYIEKLIDP
jgi:hypothetical protein